MHPKLRAIIEATPTVGVKTFLVTHFGKPYTAPGFGNWFRELCDKAGCPDVSAHGLRKATARRLAEIGCSANQIASITGHASLSEIQRYTRAADRKRMAREAMAKLIEKPLKIQQHKTLMVGPAGLPSSSDFNELKLQTILFVAFELKSAFGALTNLFV